MQGYCGVFLRIILKQTSIKAIVNRLQDRTYLQHMNTQRQQGARFEHIEVSKAIYDRFSYGTASFTPNGENVNVLLELIYNPHFVIGSGHLLPSSENRVKSFPSLKALTLKNDVILIKYNISFLADGWVCISGLRVSDVKDNGSETGIQWPGIK